MRASVLAMLFAARQASVGAYRLSHRFARTAAFRGAAARLAAGGAEDAGAPAFSSLKLLSTPGTDSAALSDFLLDVGALSVSIEDAFGNTDQETPVFDDIEESEEADIFVHPDVHNRIWRTCHITALFPSSWDVSHVVDEVASVFQLETRPGFEVSTVDGDVDWVSAVQESWKPARISDVVVRFPWHSDEDVAAQGLPLVGEEDGVHHITLQGGAAFGTGEHPTTFMCLGAVARSVREAASPVRVMDYGAGSGLLGLAALLLGAREASGVEIDRDAITSAHANAQMNGLRFQCYLPAETTLPRSGEADGEADAVLNNPFKERFNDGIERLPVDDVDYDLVVANILARPLRGLAPELARITRTGGTVLLSGVLDDQADGVIEAYAPFFEGLAVRESKRGWVLIEGRRRSG